MTASSPTNNSAPPRLVGREREMETLRGCLDAALVGRGGLVLIGGAAGIGKTALAESLCRDAEARGALVLIGRCYDLTETPPYGPWLECFARYHPTSDSPTLPAAFAQRGSVGATTSQSDILIQTRDFLAALAAKQSVLVLLDDLHWADPASLDLLRFLARDLATLPALIVATYRAEEVTRQHPLYQLLPTLVREAHANRLDVQRLDDDAVSALVAARYPLADRDAARLVAYLQARAEGNAFYLGELLRSLEGERVLHRGAGGWEIGDLTQTQIPALLRQVIDGRLARLGDDVQRSLAVAAVIGQQVPFDLWATIAASDEPTLLATIEPAVAASLLDETPDGAGARFPHALVREAVYAGIRPARRRALHRQVADALIAYRGEPDPDAVAYHLRQAGDERAVDWLVKAGERAQRADIWRAAADRYEAAIALMEMSGMDRQEHRWIRYRLGVLRRFTDPQGSIAALERAEATAVETGDAMLRAYAQYSQGLGLCMYQMNTRGVPLIEAGIDAIERLTPDDRAGRDELDTLHANVNRGQVIGKLANVGRFADARVMAEAYRATLPDPAITNSDRWAYGGLNHALLTIHAFQGYPDEARLALARAQHVGHGPGAGGHRGTVIMWGLILVTLPYDADDLDERRHLAMEAERAWKDAGLVIHNRPARTARLPLLVLEGAWGDARFLSLGAITVLTPDAIAAGRNLHSYLIGPLLRAQGETVLAWAVVREWLPDGPDAPLGCTWFVAALTLQRVAAELETDAGNLDAATAWLDAHDRWLAWSGAVLGRAEGHLAWATYHRAAGDADAAYQRAMQSFACATDPRQPLALLAAYRLLGELDTDAGRLDDAATHLDASLALADVCAAPYERALTLLALAELRIATNERAQARLMLDEARALCIPLDAKPALARIAALAARLNATKDTAPDYPAGLSAREVEVLRLIVTGQTNREIGDALSISERTVERHITHILTKTGAANRAAAVTFASHNGLMLPQ